MKSSLQLCHWHDYLCNKRGGFFVQLINERDTLMDIYFIFSYSNNPNEKLKNK